MDELVINANQLETSPDSSATALRRAALPFSIDPVLTRFQRADWTLNDKGEHKKNYLRLGREYFKGTGLWEPGRQIIVNGTVPDQWCVLAGNVIEYQRSRVGQIPTQLDLFGEVDPREMRPARLMAAALVADSPAWDHANRVLAEASAEAAGEPVAVSVIVPRERLREPDERRRLLETVPTDGVSAYFIWTPSVSEQELLSDNSLFEALLTIVSSLAERGIPVGHMYGNYVIAALHDAGISSITHHLGWVDRGNPAERDGGGPRSCRIYAPALRHCLTFNEAHALAGSLSAEEYEQQFCDCTLCAGFFERGEHPFAHLLEDQAVRIRPNYERRTPTSRATHLNTWHYLLARRQEIEAFSARPAAEVITRDLQRAAATADRGAATRLRRLATGLRTA
jgi:hypothetical protein